MGVVVACFAVVGGGALLDVFLGCQCNLWIDHFPLQLPIMLPQGGGKSEFEITFLAHPLFLEPPGALRGSFQRRPQITPISILKLPFELLSSCAFGKCFPLLM